MGLDWIAAVRMRQEDREDYIRHHHARELEAGKSLAELLKTKAPIWDKPCRIVGAPKMKELPDFQSRTNTYLSSRKDQAISEMQSEPHLRNQPFIDHWLNRTLKEQMSDDGDKYCCNHCPLLDKLNGADSQGSLFLGITVASCDFRGKMIGADGALGDLADEAYTEHDPDEMLEYADRLEAALDNLRHRGLLTKDSYERYARQHQQDSFAQALGERMLSLEEYSRQLHWRERNIREAVHWLRTCASYDIHMQPYY